MQTVREDINSIFLSNAQLIENGAVWIGSGKYTPNLTLSDELAATFPTLPERIKSFTVRLFKASIFYSFFLVLTSPV